jgi:hypothetical protein
MEGGFSFVEQGCESKRPGRETANVTADYKPTESALTMLGYPQGKLSWGGIFLVTFLLLQTTTVRNNSHSGKDRCNLSHSSRSFRRRRAI